MTTIKQRKQLLLRTQKRLWWLFGTKNSENHYYTNAAETTKLWLSELWGISLRIKDTKILSPRYNTGQLDFLRFILALKESKIMPRELVPLFLKSFLLPVYLMSYCNNNSLCCLLHVKERCCTWTPEKYQNISSCTLVTKMFFSSWIFLWAQMVEKLW